MPHPQTLATVTNTPNDVDMLARLSAHSLLVPQAQQAALFQRIMGMRSPAPQPVVPGNTATQGALTAEQQLSIKVLLFLVVPRFLLFPPLLKRLVAKHQRYSHER
jgi:hypothetical protein